MRGATFHLDNPESKGVFVSAFKEQKPILLNDISEIEKNLSKRSQQLAKQMDVQSLICVPVVYEKESLGIVSVDNVNPERPLTQSDLSLLMGVASQMAVSIVNAMFFEKRAATTGIKWTHLADMYGPTSDESNNNQKASFPNCFSFKSLLKIRGLRLLKEKQLVRCNEKITG